MTIDGLFVANVIARVTNSIGMAVDREACVSICAYNEPDTACEAVSVQNSIASGCLFAGFIAPGHTCGEAETQTNFKNNVAHSIAGHGGRIYPDPSIAAHADTCYEGSYFSAYHN